MGENLRIQLNHLILNKDFYKQALKRKYGIIFAFTSMVKTEELLNGSN